ncbi:MFS transporter [Asanoa sp. NPDC049518]|uniref:MFS transporter n=1 Tax=unclassified Asanoa TaxID=2685164 RepID=UPI00341614FF
MARARARVVSLVLTLLVAAAATISWPALGATAAPIPTRAPGDVCSIEQWEANFAACVDKLPAVTADRVQCLKAPTPSTPDAGLAGWFSDRPESSRKSGLLGMYGTYGYAGYSYTTYDVEGGCASSVLHPDYRFLTTVANGEFMIATAVIGASNAVRERAWDPQSMWGWADPLVDQATKAVYTRVFTAFGAITLAVVGLYLIWRSRQSDMSNALTTTGWALLVMVAVTALAAWPVKSANIADDTLVSALGVVHDAVGPRPKDGQCVFDDDPQACKDNRPPAVRASDTVTETMLYRNWLRGVLGSADSNTAKKYGEALYDAKSFTWTELEQIRANPKSRDGVIARKSNQWMKVAEQIKTEDPEAYEYLQGSRDMERVGAGFIALLAAFLFALFDLTASLLVLLGFLIFRWAVIAAPILGTIGLMRPASAGIRRLANAVVAAVFNIAIFGTGAAIYLFAVDLVMNTPTLPGWLQVVLVWLTGVVGWLLLRPYRRITQLGGKDSTSAITSAGSWHRRFFRDMREAAKLDVAEPGGTAEPRLGKGRGVVAEQTSLRPEARLEDPSHAAPSGGERVRPEERSDVPTTTPERAPVASPPRRQPARWVEPDVPETAPASYAIYRPEPAKDVPTASPKIRSEAR